MNSDEPDINIVHQFNIVNLTYSLVEVYNLMSALFVI